MCVAAFHPVVCDRPFIIDAARKPPRTTSKTPTAAMIAYDEASIAWYCGGGICFAIPEAAGVTWSSLFSMSTPEQSLGAQASGMSAPTNCLAASSSGSSNFNPVECVFHNLSVDCAPQFVLLVLVVAGCAGLFMWWQFVKASVEKVSYGDPSMKLPWGSAIIGTLFLGVGAVVEMFGTALGFAQGIITSNGFTSNSSMIAYLPNYSSLCPSSSCRV